MERIIPQKALILSPLIGHGNKKKDYLTEIQRFERECEKNLIETLSKLDITASVKTDPYSLPFRDEEIVTLYGQSYLNGPYEFYRVARRIVKRLLNEDVYKLRFYLFINVLDDHMGFGKVEYRFRYFAKDI